MADDTIIGMNYFDFQFLTKEDFDVARDHPISRLQRHNRLLHSPGVIQDLVVTTPGAPGSKRVVVTAGRALDEAHQEVLLPANVDPVDLSGLPISAEPAFVTIQLRARLTVPSNDPSVAHLPESQRSRRTEEFASLEVSTTPPSGAQLLLARINRDATGKVVGDPVLTDRKQSAPVLADGSIAGQKLVNGAITQDKILDGAVSTNKIANNAVNQNKILDGAVTPSKITDKTLPLTKLVATPGVLPSETTVFTITGTDIEEVPVGPVDTFRLINVELVLATPATVARNLVWTYVIRLDLPTPEARVMVRQVPAVAGQSIQFRVRWLDLGKP